MTATPNELVRIVHLLSLEELEKKLRYIKLCSERTLL